MQRRLTWILFVVLGRGTIAIAVRVLYADLAAPPAFGQVDLAAFLRNPTNDPVVVRRAARQLDRDFHAGHDWQPTVDALPPGERRAFVANFQGLMVLLLEQRAALFRRQPSYRRERFLDGQLQEFANWYVVGEKEKSSGLGLLRQGLLAINAGAAPVPVSPPVRDYLRALQGHLLKRSMERFLPTGGKATSS